MIKGLFTFGILRHKLNLYNLIIQYSKWINILTTVQQINNRINLVTEVLIQYVLYFSIARKSTEIVVSCISDCISGIQVGPI